MRRNALLAAVALLAMPLVGVCAQATDPLRVDRPTIVAFDMRRPGASMRNQARALRAALDSLDMTIIAREGVAMIPYLSDGGTVVYWMPSPDTLPMGYLFLKPRATLVYVHYGALPDSTLRAAARAWYEPPASSIVIVKIQPLDPKKPPEK